MEPCCKGGSGQFRCLPAPFMQALQDAAAVQAWQRIESRAQLCYTHYGDGGGAAGTLYLWGSNFTLHPPPCPALSVHRCGVG